VPTVSAPAATVTVSDAGTSSSADDSDPTPPQSAPSSAGSATPVAVSGGS
jgi:hypothetical protein